MNKVIWLIGLVLCFTVIGIHIKRFQKENEIKNQNKKTELINNILDCTYSTESKQFKLCLELNLE